MKAVEVAHKYPPDLFHAHQMTTPSIAGYLYKRFSKAKSLLKYGGDLVFNYLAASIPDPKEGISPDRSHLGAELAAKVQMHLFDTYDHIYAITHYGLTELARYGVPKEKTSLIHNCVDLDHFTPAKRGRDHEHRFVMTAGRHVKHKGIDDTIRAFQIIKQNVPDLSLVVLGSGPDTQELQRNLGQAVSNVRFLGTVSDEELRDYYSKAELFLYTPFGCEGLDNVILESLASGTPVIGYRFPHVTEAVRNGYNGHLVQPGDVVSVARHATRVLNNSRLRRSLAVNARRVAEEEFSPELMTAGVLSVYKMMAESR
jgi:glycosyltransferase involved in cell wall biosynthesis